MPRVFAALWPAVGCFAALARDRRGMSAVEFGIAAPVFLAILMPVVDLGRAYSQQIQVRQAVQAGALYASVNVYNSGTWSTSRCLSTVSPPAGR